MCCHWDCVVVVNVQGWRCVKGREICFRYRLHGLEIADVFDMEVFFMSLYQLIRRHISDVICLARQSNTPQEQQEDLRS